jgi:hypothetical protein
MGRTDVSQLRKRAKKAIDTITVGGLDPDDHCKFFYLLNGDQPFEIAQEKFFDEQAPPGRYRFRVVDAKGVVIAEGDGEHLEFRAGDGEDERPNGHAAMARTVSSLCHSSAAEVERAHRRLREEEERNDNLKQHQLVLEAALCDRDRKIAELRAELETARDEDLGEFAEILGQIAIRVLGLDQQDPARAEDLEIVLNAVSKSQEVQAQLQQICGEAPLRRLGIGGAP